MQQAPTNLVELGEITLARISSEMARGGGLLRCQLIASPFQIALKDELSSYHSAAELLERASKVSLLVMELQLVVAMLKMSFGPAIPTTRKPSLRVIAGGRA